jgi:ubiquinone/menaquinone biosynthesis C-methylase UbiE
MPEDFQPFAHQSAGGLWNKIILFIRLILDFQFQTTYLFLKNNLRFVKGNIIDVGCGNSPFKHLLDDKVTNYTGLDYNNSGSFKYKRSDIVYFDGKQFPFGDNTFDFLLCTEVLEHIPEPRLFIEEAYRILKNGGKAIYTVPWSARYHYIPFDYYRYTPSALGILFSKFKKVEIKSRGTEVTVIANKLIVLFSRILLNMFTNFKKVAFLFQLLAGLVFLIMLLPIVLLFILLGHLSIWFAIGSPDDCLGYTVILEK